MTLKEKQDKARLNFVCNWLGDANILANANDHEIIMTTSFEDDIPYLYITISAMSEEQGNKKIHELLERQNYFNKK